MKINYVIFASILFIAPIYGMKGPTSQLSINQFKDLARYTQSYLKNNIKRLACQKNESGFIRLNIPVKDCKANIPALKKLRINFWAPDAGVPIIPESIHTHPRYFESCIINGGYTHELYHPGTKKDELYQAYKIVKNFDEKSFIFMGETALKFYKKEDKKSGDIVVFDKELIHRVETTNPETLSINTVFTDGDDDNISSYMVYLSKYGNLHDIKTDREVILNKQSKTFIEKVIEYIGRFIK